MINIDEILNDEKYNLELKEEVDFKESKNYLKAVSSFANGFDVGFLIFGIEDGTKKIVGINDVKKSYEEISNRIKSRIEPSIIPIIDIIEYKSKKIIVVKVLPGGHTPYYYVNKGTRIAYVRKGDQDNQANSLELNELILRGKNEGWDEQITEKEFKDFTFNTLKEEFRNEKDIEITDNDLKSFELISKDNRLTNAAVLFSDQNNHTGSFISCTRWDGLEKIDAKDDIEYYGSIISQIKNTMEFVKKHMSNGWTRTGEVRRKNIPEYDLEAVREAVINAESHRQYLFRGAQIEFGMYDDRIEIMSFGGIDFGYTLEELLSKHLSSRRNPLICDIFSRLDYMERRGSGIKKIMDAYAKDKKKPKFEIIGKNTFCVTFYSRLYKEKNDTANDTANDTLNDTVKLNKTEMKILEIIIKNPSITQDEIAKEMNIAIITVKRNTNKLKEKGIIERVGADKNGHWEIKITE